MSSSKAICITTSGHYNVLTRISYLIAGYRGSDCSVESSKPPAIESFTPDECRLSSESDQCALLLNLTVSNIAVTDVVRCQVTYVKVFFKTTLCKL